jgi:muramoyltetrapeptide carboxypeptidase
VLKPGRPTRPRIIVPPPLAPGDLIGVVAPGSVVDREAAHAGVKVLEGMGLRVRTGRALLARHGTFAGDDGARAADLAAMLADDEVRAVHFARGGWGTSRFLETVDWRSLRARPKLLIGYSDLTALFAPALDRAGITSIYGPHVTEIGRDTTWDRPSLARAYFRPREPLTLSFPARDVLAAGGASGRAAGGCLTLLAHLAGTPYAPRLRGRILILEEIAEPPYRIDRLMTQLRLAGMLDGVRGVLIGGLTDCGSPTGPRSVPTAARVVASYFTRRGVPVVAGLRFGHVNGKISVPIGFRVQLDTKSGRAVFLP